jgi:hypothetical protein
LNTHYRNLNYDQAQSMFREFINSCPLVVDSICRDCYFIINQKKSQNLNSEVLGLMETGVREQECEMSEVKERISKLNAIENILVTKEVLGYFDQIYLILKCFLVIS